MRTQKETFWKDIEKAQKDPEFIRTIYEWVRKTCSR